MYSLRKSARVKLYRHASCPERDELLKNFKLLSYYAKMAVDCFAGLAARQLSCLWRSDAVAPSPSCTWGPRSLATCKRAAVPIIYLLVGEYSRGADIMKLRRRIAQDGPHGLARAYEDGCAVTERSLLRSALTRPPVHAGGFFCFACRP